MATPAIGISNPRSPHSSQGPAAPPPSPHLPGQAARVDEAARQGLPYITVRDAVIGLQHLCVVERTETDSIKVTFSGGAAKIFRYGVGREALEERESDYQKILMAWAQAGS